MEWREIIEELEGKVLLLYGEAGCGKTNIAMQLMSVMCRETDRPCYFISTEGPQYLSLLDRYSLGSNCYFATALSSDHLIKLLMDILVSDRPALMIIIDTVNSFYRVEATQIKNAESILAAITSLASYMADKYNGIALLTAQVREAESGEEVSGESLIKFWVDVTVKCEKVKAGEGVLIVRKGNTAYRKMRFTIGDSGVELANGV